MASDDTTAEPIDSPDDEDQPGHRAGTDAPVSAGEVLTGRSWHSAGAVTDPDDERDIRGDSAEDRDDEPPNGERA